MTIGTIKQIETIPFRLPMHGALRWGKYSQLDAAEHVLVRVTLADGATGTAEALPRPTIYGETVQSICHVIENLFEPRLLNQQIDYAQIHARLAEIKNNQTAHGAIDMAIHAAVAQSKQQTLAELLGVDLNANIRVSYILGVGDNDTLIAEAQRVFDLGVRVLKVKVGRNWQADIERIQLIKQISPKLEFYIDANETMELETAADRLDQLRALGCLYCEEPLPVEQVSARAKLQAGQHLPLIGDDSCFSLRDLKREIELDTFDVLNIKCARTGYTESKQMLLAARTADKGIMVGSQASSRLGAARHAIFAASAGINHPSELSFFLKMKSDIVNQEIEIKDGYLNIATIANLQVDPALLREHQL